MSAPTVHTTHDSKGRLRRIYICDLGHWHRSFNQSVKCNQKGRQS